jgi:hypothetical protein
VKQQTQTTSKISNTNTLYLHHNNTLTSNGIYKVLLYRTSSKLTKRKE